MSQQQAIIDSLKSCFTSEFFAKPQNLSWKSAIFGLGTTPKPIRIDMMLMLQQGTILKATGVGSIAKKAEAVPMIVKAVKENPTELNFLSILPGQGEGKELILYNPDGNNNNNNVNADAAGSSAPTQQNNLKVTTTNNNNDEQKSSSGGTNTAPTPTTSATATATDGSSEDERTVFAKPIHFKATESEIIEFFSQYGTVTSVERRRFLERGVAKLKPSIFVMFASKEDARRCVAARPSYGKCPSQLGSMFVPHLMVSMKDDPNCRDAISDEIERAKKAAEDENNKLNSHGDENNNNGGPSHRRLINRGLICVARGVPMEFEARVISAKLGSIFGVGKGIIDTAYFPSDQEQMMNSSSGAAAATATKPNTKVCYVYCTSAMAAATLLKCYQRVFSENEKYAESLAPAVPSLEKCTDSEEEMAMELYGEAVAGRTQKKMQRNAQVHGQGHGKKPYQNSTLQHHHETQRRERE